MTTKRHEDDDGPPYDDARLRRFFCDGAADLGFSAAFIGDRGGSHSGDPDARLWNKGVVRWGTDKKGPGTATGNRAIHELLQKLSPATIDVLYRAYGPESACPALSLRDNPPARARLGRWRFLLEKTEAARAAFAKANQAVLAVLIAEQEKLEPSRREAIEASKLVLVDVQHEVTEDDELYEKTDLPWHSTAQQSKRDAAYNVAMVSGPRVSENDEAFTFAFWLQHKASASELRAARKEAAAMVKAAWDAWVDVAGAPKSRAPRHEKLERESDR